MASPHHLFLIGALALGLLMPGTAFACRVSVAAPRIDGPLVAIVVVDIVEARDTEVPGWWTWDVQANVHEVVSGATKATAYQFLRTTGSNGCAAAQPTGRWVLYIAADPDGERVVEALSLDRAEAVDTRISALNLSPY